MRIAHAADFHFGHGEYGLITPDGNSRVLDYKATFNCLIDKVLDASVDVFLIAGDLFRSPKAQGDEITTAVETILAGLRRVSNAGITTHIIHGTPGHDGPLPRLIQVANLESVWFHESPSIVSGRTPYEQYAIAALPGIDKKVLLASEEHKNLSPIEQHVMLRQKLMDIARGLSLQIKDEETKILMLHYTLDNATTSSEQMIQLHSDIVLPVNELLSQGWDVIAAGHIHKAQVLQAWPFVGYSGSMERTDFSETEDKGFYIIDTKDQSSQFVTLPARPFVTAELDLTGLDGTTLHNYTLDLNVEDPTNGLVKLLYKSTEESLLYFNLSEFIAGFEKEHNCRVVVKQPIIERTERQRSASITESLDPLAAVTAYIDEHEELENQRESLISLAAEIFAEIGKEGK